jgi:hypothetical protein
MTLHEWEKATKQELENEVMRLVGITGRSELRNRLIADMKGNSELFFIKPDGKLTVTYTQKTGFFHFNIVYKGGVDGFFSLNLIDQKP